MNTGVIQLQGRNKRHLSDFEAMNQKDHSLVSLEDFFKIWSKKSGLLVTPVQTVCVFERIH